MKVIVKDFKQCKTNVTLDDKDYITEGGEGKIYGKGDTIYKIFLDPSKMIPIKKIEQLSVLNRDNILKPKEIIFDNNKSNPIGFTMDWITDTFPLCKLFSKDFKNRFNINNKTISSLIESIAENLNFIHSFGILLVDGNENNYLVDKNFHIPYFIDVNSWQTKDFPATVQMLSIKDYHTKGFSNLTDWFAFAIVSCQLFIGIHPFKGTHPKYKRNDLENRMKNNISIFNKDVSMPSAAGDINTIPNEYKNWFIDLFEKGKRCLPPSSMGVILIRPNDVIIKKDESQKLLMKLISSFKEKIIKYSNDFVILENGKICDLNGKLMLDENKVNDYEIWKQDDNNIICNIENGFLKLKTNSKKELIYSNIKCQDKMVFDSVLLIKNYDKLISMNSVEINDRIAIGTNNTWNVMPNSTILFDGVIYQNLLGVHYFTVPSLNDNGKVSMNQFIINELKDHQIMEAKYNNKILIILAKRKSENTYDNFIFKINNNKQYLFDKREDVQYSIPNFNVLHNGIVVLISENDDIQIFSNDINKKEIKVINDNIVNYSFKLIRSKTNILAIKHNNIYSLSMK